MKYMYNTKFEGRIDFPEDGLSFLYPITGDGDVDLWKFLYYDCVYPMRALLKNYSEFKPSVVIDIGSCIGMLAIFAAKQGAETVVAVEPAPDNFVNILENISLNNTSKIRSLLCAITNKDDDKRMIYRAGGNVGQTSLEFNSAVSYDAMRVVTVSFNSLMNDYQEVDYLKIDVEGAEYEFIDDTAIESLKKVKFLDIDTHPITDDFYKPETFRQYSKYNAHKELLEFLERIGFVKVFENNKRVWRNKELTENYKWVENYTPKYNADGGIEL